MKDGDDPTKNFKPNRNRILGMRFEFIKEYLRSLFFENYNENIDESINELISFYDDLNSAEILRIRVPNLNDAFTIFTSFNAKGVPLTLIDLFKSFFLKESDGNLSEEMAMEKWKELISIFYNENNEPISSVVTQFLLNNYDTFESDTLSSITQNSALDVYEVIFSNKGFEYIDTLIYRAKLFSNINGKIATVEMFNFESDTKKLLEKLDRLNITQVYPLVLYGLHEFYEERITESLLQDLLTFLVTFYVRRNIILKPKASNIRARSLRSVRKLQEVDIIEISNIDEVKEILQVIAASDEEFKTALSGPLYTISKNTTRIILIDLERKYGTFFNNQVSDNLDGYSDNGRFIWTLEHIMPQSADTNEHWRQMLAQKVDNEDQIPIVLEENVHKVDNLTLTGYNSEMSAKPFIEKRDHRDSRTNVETGLKTELFLNDSISEEGQNINVKDEWKLTDITRRTNFLINKILPIYKFS